MLWQRIGVNIYSTGDDLAARVSVASIEAMKEGHMVIGVTIGPYSDFNIIAVVPIEGMSVRGIYLLLAASDICVEPPKHLDYPKKIAFCCVICC